MLMFRLVLMFRCMARQVCEMVTRLGLVAKASVPRQQPPSLPWIETGAFRSSRGPPMMTS